MDTSTFITSTGLLSTFTHHNETPESPAIYRSGTAHALLPHWSVTLRGNQVVIPIPKVVAAAEPSENIPPPYREVSADSDVKKRGARYQLKVLQNTEPSENIPPPPSAYRDVFTHLNIRFDRIIG